MEASARSITIASSAAVRATPGGGADHAPRGWSSSRPGTRCKHLVTVVVTKMRACRSEPSESESSELTARAASRVEGGRDYAATLWGREANTRAGLRDFHQEKP